MTKQWNGCGGLLVKEEAKSNFVVVWREQLGGIWEWGSDREPQQTVLFPEPQATNLNRVRIRRPAGSPQKQNRQTGFPSCRCEGAKVRVLASRLRSF